MKRLLLASFALLIAGCNSEPERVVVAPTPEPSISRIVPTPTNEVVQSNEAPSPPLFQTVPDQQVVSFVPPKPTPTATPTSRPLRIVRSLRRIDNQQIERLPVPDNAQVVRPTSSAIDSRLEAPVRAEVPSFQSMPFRQALNLATNFIDRSTSADEMAIASGQFAQWQYQLTQERDALWNSRHDINQRTSYVYRISAAEALSDWALAKMQFLQGTSPQGRYPLQRDAALIKIRMSLS